MSTSKLLVAVLLLAACGKAAPTRYHHKGSLEFSLDLPPGWKAGVEKADGDWKDVILSSDDSGLDVLINWRPGWSFDELLTWFNAVQTRLGSVVVYTKQDLPNGAGYFLHYNREGIEYAKAVVRCGKEALHCMATISGTVKAGEKKEQGIALCRTVTCP